MSKLAEKYNDFNLQLKCCQCRINCGVALNYFVNLHRLAQRSSVAQSRTDANPGQVSPAQSSAGPSDTLAPEAVLQESHSGSIAQFQLAASKLERMEVAYPGSEAVRQELHACYENMQPPLKLEGREGEVREYFQRDVALQARDPKAKLGTFTAITFKRDSLGNAQAALAAGGRKLASESLDQAMRDVRRTLEMVEPASLDKDTLTKLSVQCRDVARVAEKLERWPEAIEFDRRQVELQRGAVLTDLLKDGNSSLARDCVAAGRPDQARAAWEELVRLDAFSDFHKEDDNHHAIADLGDKLAALGQPADIDLVLAPGLAERRKRLAEQPADEKVRNELLHAYRTLGHVHECAHRFSAALQAYDQGLALGPHRKSENPFDFDGTVYSRIYRDTLIGRMVCLDALGRTDGADQAFRESHTTSSFRATKLAENGQPERAVKLAESWLREEKASVGKHYDAAGVFAAASTCESLEPSLKGQYADRAVALLGEARALGYFDDAKHVAEAKSKSALDPLRQREDFKKMLAELGTFESAFRTREAVPYLAKLSAANPNDTELWVELAACQAWFGQDQELAATRQRILALAKDTGDMLTAERAAKVCTIVPPTDKAEQEAGLALARKAVELGKSGGWNLLALGMAEYRSGHDAAAAETLLAAAEASTNSYFVTGTAALYRAMSIYRAGKPDVARKIAIEAVAKMKPLPNPSLDIPYYRDDLVLWLAYKEAKAMIKFDESPPPEVKDSQN